MLRLRNQVEQEFSEVSLCIQQVNRFDDHFNRVMEQVFQSVEHIAMDVIGDENSGLDSIVSRFNKISYDFSTDETQVKSREQLLADLPNQSVSLLLEEYFSYFAAAVYPRILKSEAYRMERKIS